MLKIKLFSAGVTVVSAAYILYDRKNRENVFMEAKKKLECKSQNMSPVRSDTYEMDRLLTPVIKDLSNEKVDLKNKIIPFVTSTVNVVHLGCPEIDSFVFLGIPQHFLIFNEKKKLLSKVSFLIIAVQELGILTMHIVRAMQDGRNLQTNLIVAFSLFVSGVSNPEESNLILDAITLSEEAKKFGIASEILKSIRIPHSPFHMVVLLFVIQGNILSWGLNLIQKRMRRKFTLASHIMAFTISFLVVYLSIGHVMSNEELKADLELCRLRESYKEGAIEYYNKISEVYELTKKKESTISSDENKTRKWNFWRPYTLPLSERINYIKNYDPKKPTFWQKIQMKF